MGVVGGGSGRGWRGEWVWWEEGEGEGEVGEGRGVMGRERGSGYGGRCSYVHKKESPLDWHTVCLLSNQIIALVYLSN